MPEPSPPNRLINPTGAPGPVAPKPEESNNDNPEKIGIQVATVAAVVILVLFGLYWAGKLLLLPEKADHQKLPPPAGGAEVAIETECKNPTVYTSIKSALGNPKNVCKMDLSGQGLNRLPIAIGYFSNLIELDISNNNISRLPSEIGWLRSLKRFDASHNNLTRLALEIGWLRELREWNLAYNQITRLPSEIGWLQKMENLNLANNQLRGVPIELGWMSKMKTLDLSGNSPQVAPSARRLKPYMRDAKIILP